MIWIAEVGGERFQVDLIHIASGSRSPARSSSDC